MIFDGVWLNQSRTLLLLRDVLSKAAASVPPDCVLGSRPTARWQGLGCRRDSVDDALQHRLERTWNLAVLNENLLSTTGYDTISTVSGHLQHPAPVDICQSCYNSVFRSSLCVFRMTPSTIIFKGAVRQRSNQCTSTPGKFEEAQFAALKQGGRAAILQTASSLTFTLFIIQLNFARISQSSLFVLVCFFRPKLLSTPEDLADDSMANLHF